MANLGFTMTYKNANGVLIPLYPSTNINQVIDWNLGEVYGPYTITLPASNWANLSQTITLNGVLATDKIKCVKILTGSKSDMEAQEQAYARLNTASGIRSALNSVTFTCSNQAPTVDLQVQLSWIR